MKVLITGASGFVGSHLLDLLLKGNNEVGIIARKNSKLDIDESQVKIYRCGLEKPDLLINIVNKYDYIIHLAGCVRALKYETYRHINSTLTDNLLNACLTSKKEHKKITIVSSLACAGPSINSLNTEEDTPKPVSFYGKSKLEQEKTTQSYFSKLNINIVRPPAVYGPRDTDIYLFFKTINQGFYPQAGINDKYLSLIHVHDLIDGILKCTTSGRNSEIYNITHPQIVSWDDLAQESGKALNKKYFKITIPHFVLYILAFINETISIFTKKAAIVNMDKINEIKQTAWTCSADKIMTELNFQPKFDLQTGIHNTINWYKINNWLK